MSQVYSMQDHFPLVPLEVQLAAVCLPIESQAQTLLVPYLPSLRSWEFQREPLESYKARVRKHFSFTPKELIAYLQVHPETAQALLQYSYDKRYSPSTFIEEWQNDQYRVGWVRARGMPAITQIRVFQHFAEAVADYVLFSWGMPRLSKEHATWYEIDHY